MAAQEGEFSIVAADGRKGRKAFVALGYRLNRADPNWVPPLRSEAEELVDPAKNPFFEHAEVQLFLARRGGRDVGRISAHIDHLALAMPSEQGMGPGTGNWGLLDAEDEDVARALILCAEDWLRDRGMTRVLAPIALSIWEEPGLLTKGHDHPPMVMMGHHQPHYQRWIEATGYTPAKILRTFDLDVTRPFPPLVQRIIDSGRKNTNIAIRPVRAADFEREAALILDIFNDAWATNWGFVPITDREIAHVGKKLKPLVHDDLIMIAAYEGSPVAFMMTLPDLNEPIRELGGRLFPFGWLKLLRWLRKPMGAGMRVPLMGVRKHLQNSRLAGQLAFMMIERIRLNATSRLGTTRGEIGWILEDNQGMNAIARTIGAKVNREYTIYEKSLG